jgi:pentatricopeptide repeat protein
MGIYEDFLRTNRNALTAWIFVTMLRTCSRRRRYNEAWHIWKDWNVWWETQVGEQSSNNQRKETDMKHIGCTNEMRYETYRRMIHLVARYLHLRVVISLSSYFSCSPVYLVIMHRSNNIHSAVGLLEQLASVCKPRRRDFMLLQHRCIELNNHEALGRVLDLCEEQPRTGRLRVREILGRKWKGSIYKNTWDARARKRSVKFAAQRIPSDKRLAVR